MEGRSLNSLCFTLFNRRRSLNLSCFYTLDWSPVVTFTVFLRSRKSIDLAVAPPRPRRDRALTSLARAMLHPIFATWPQGVYKRSGVPWQSIREL